MDLLLVDLKLVKVGASLRATSFLSHSHPLGPPVLPSVLPVTPAALFNIPVISYHIINRLAGIFEQLNNVH